MRKQRLRLKAIGTCLFVAALSGLLAAPASASPRDFVTRSGSQLMLDGKPFRFSGANVEWLGLIGYGPLNFEPGQHERFPSHYEVDDALATAKEMGATVVRAQSLGDTVGCPNCLEPKLGEFNAKAFRVIDYAVARARAYGIRLILEFLGDARAEHVGSTADVFSRWRGGADFWSDPTVLQDVENHIAHLVNHVNSITGIAYKDDPTILGWMDCNVCQLNASSSAHGEASWVQTIAAYVKSLDHRHLFLSNAAVFFPDAAVLADPNIDVVAEEIWPHWLSPVWGDQGSGQAPQPHAAAAETTAAGKVWMMSEFGWDHTNWQTPAALQTFLDGTEQDANISGDLFWNLDGHTNGHGWTPVPANMQCQAGANDTSPPTEPSPDGSGCANNEDGNWWALYYTGLKTLSNTADDMAARAQAMRTHAYRMRGVKTPPHDIPPAPIITSTDGGKVVFQGAAGAATYSVERWNGKAWTTICDKCTTDAVGGYEADGPGCFRVIPYNLDAVAGPASNPAGSGCPVSSPQPKMCASRRSVTFALPRGATGVKVTVDGKARPLPRHGRSLIFALNGLPRRAVTVRITARLRNHTLYRRTTTLHTCIPKRKTS